MGVSIVHYSYQDQLGWGVIAGETVLCCHASYGSTASFLREGRREAQQIAEGLVKPAGSLPLTDVMLLSPVTQPANIIAQQVNADTESEWQRQSPPTFYQKAASAITGPNDPIVKPSSITQLDYGVTLGLVVGQALTSPTVVTRENVGQYIAGLVIVNDVTTQDKPSRTKQALLANSYRTFCPVGPYLYLLDDNEFETLDSLTLSLAVNGELRQYGHANIRRFTPEMLFTELSAIIDLAVGDLILTGPPQAVSQEEAAAATHWSAQAKRSATNGLRSLWSRGQSANRFLKIGDRIQATVGTPDNSIELGTQESRVVTASQIQSVVAVEQLNEDDLSLTFAEQLSEKKAPMAAFLTGIAAILSVVWIFARRHDSGDEE